MLLTRLRWLQTGAFVLFAGLTVRLGDLQIRQHETLLEIGTNQWLDAVPVPAERGNIYDRQGRSLALSVTTWRVGVSTTSLRGKDPGECAAIADRVAGIFDLNPVETRRRLTEAGGKHIVLASRAVLHRDSLLALRRLGCVTFDVQHDRVYPQGGTGASLLGHFRDTGNGAVANGLEQAYDELLAGTPGEAWRHKTPHRGPGDGLEVVTPARDGLDLVLTIDADLQAIAEDCLEIAVPECHAIGGAVLIIDPNTGEVLAAADTPVIRDRTEAAEHKRFWDNYNFTGSYEPGSVFKIFTAASLLARDAVDTTLAIDCDDQQFDGYRIRNSEGHDFGFMSFMDAFAHSSNVYFARMVLNLRRDEFFRDLQLLGFGKPTGAVYPGQTRGLCKPMKDWSGRTQSTIAFGQEITASPLQVALAGATVANGGRLMAPMMVREVRTKNGSVVERREPVVYQEVMSERLAEVIRGAMLRAVTEGTGGKASVPWTTVAGKTGTAQKVREGATGYEYGVYIASFLGMVPADEPRLLILTILDEPDQSHHYASASAAPLFARVVEQIGRSTSWLSGVAVRKGAWRTDEGQSQVTAWR